VHDATPEHAELMVDVVQWLLNTEECSDLQSGPIPRWDEDALTADGEAAPDMLSLTITPISAFLLDVPPEATRNPEASHEHSPPQCNSLNSCLELIP